MRRPVPRLLPVLVGAALLAIPATASALTFNVDVQTDKADANAADGLCRTSDNTCTLRAAVQQANSSAGPDAINVPAGTYANTLGAINITSTVDIIGSAGSRATTIDAKNSDSPITMSGASTVNVRGLAITRYLGATTPILITGATVTLRDLNVHDNTVTGGQGGGLYIGSGDLTLRDSAVTDNVATAANGAFGGGLDLAGGNVRVIATTIARNTARATAVGSTAFGGGIVTQATSLNLNHVTLLDNTATSGSAAQGGGNIYVGGDTQITDSILTGGVAGSGHNCTGSGAPLSITGKNIYEGSASSCTFPAGTVVATTGGLGALGDHGGPGLTAVPQAGGAALNAASACPDDGRDQRGNPAPSGSGCDIGAVETGADLQTTLTASATSTTPGDHVTYVAKVVNAGLDTTAATTLALTPPAGATVVLVSPSSGTCDAALTCDLGPLEGGRSAGVVLVVTVPAAPAMTATATATANIPDPTPGDATAAATTAITPGSGGTPVVPPPTADRTAPVLGKLAAAGRLVARKGGTLTARLDEDATVTVLVQRQAKGRKAKGRCSAKARRGTRCTITSTVGTITAAGSRAGTVRISLPGKLGRRPVTAGTYLLTAVATDAAGNRSKAITATVKVTPAPKKKRR